MHIKGFGVPLNSLLSSIFISSSFKSPVSSTRETVIKNYAGNKLEKNIHLPAFLRASMSG